MFTRMLLRARCANPIRFCSLLLGILLTFELCLLIYNFSLLTTYVLRSNSFGLRRSKIIDLQEIFQAVAATEFANEESLKDPDVYYPKEVFQIDWRQKINKSELLHEAALHRGCLKHRNSVIPSEFGSVNQDTTQDLVLLINESDPHLLEKLRQCPDADVFVPVGLRSLGYCEDAAAYTHFLNARMLPQWVMEFKSQDKLTNRTITYHDLCPTTPMIFFNHYWDNVPNAPEWPPMKPLYLMPNVEMYELKSDHIWRADVILCKTLLCARYMRLWFEQEGNPRRTQVLYTRHTTSNLALTLMSQLTASEAAAWPEKNFTNVSILHTAGTSNQKGTTQVLDCWLSRPDFPPLELFMSQKLYDKEISKTYGEMIDKSKNVLLHVGHLEPAAFGRLTANAAYFMCSSRQEGYGHYINQARSSRSFIFTTDVAPMNELITASSGILIKAATITNEDQFLGGRSNVTHALRNVSGFTAEFDGRAVCDAVTNMLEHTTIEERIKRADRALQQYFFDTIFFAQKMQELRKNARALNKLSSKHISTSTM